MKNKKVVVTGAGGFIGSHLVEELLSIGAEVTAFVRYNSKSDFGFINNLKNNNLTICQGDLRDFDSVNNAIKGKEIVFHLGASVGIPYSYVNPWDAFETNVRGTLNVLTSVKNFNIEKMIHTSTSETYGTAQYTPMDELHPLKGQSPYSASKIAADKLVESFWLSYDTPVATVRPFNTYGPRQSARAIIPTIINQALTKNKVSLGSLDPKRDLTFVRDTVAGFISIANSPKTLGEVVNLGSGSAISIGDLANKIIDLIGTDVEINFDGSRERPEKSEVMHLCGDTSKVFELTGWNPEIDINEGLRLTIDWIKSNLDLFKSEIYTV